MLNITLGVWGIIEADSVFAWTLVVMNWVAAALCFLTAVWIYYINKVRKRERQEWEKTIEFVQQQNTEK